MIIPFWLFERVCGAVAGVEQGGIYPPLLFLEIVCYTGSNDICLYIIFTFIMQ